MVAQSANDIQVKIFRYDPFYHSKHYYQSYSIPTSEPTTVMDLLIYIYHHLDNSLSFRNYTCYRGTCLSCLVKVDGKNVRACSTLIQPGATVSIDPFRREQVIRDLVVDFNKSTKNKEYGL